MSKDHEELVDGKGRCSVPMWSGGCPAGFCDSPAFGYREKCKDGYWRDGYTGERKRHDMKYDGYVPGLACPGHGGPKKEEMAHKGDPCEFCGAAHDAIAAGPCPKRIEKNKLNRD